MSNIIVALPKQEDAKHISDILRRYGLKTTAICTTGSKILSTMQQLESGILICTRRFSDMYYTQFLEYKPEHFEILLLVPKTGLDTRVPDIMTLTLPLRASDLSNTVEMMLVQQNRRLKKKKSVPKKRSSEEQKYIDDAKRALMTKNNMVEEEAFRYIQKCSMDSGTNMVEVAQMILSMIDF